MESKSHKICCPQSTSYGHNEMNTNIYLFLVTEEEEKQKKKKKKKEAFSSK